MFCSFCRFGSSDLSLGKLFWYRRYDHAMIAFLQCIKQIGDEAEALDRTFKLPYRIEKDLINNVSIKYQIYSTEETWTRALKFMLTNLKFLIFFACKRDNSQQ